MDTHPVKALIRRLAHVAAIAVATKNRVETHRHNPRKLTKQLETYGLPDIWIPSALKEHRRLLSRTSIHFLRYS